MYDEVRMTASSRLAVFIATVGFAGYSPVAPGTVGAALAAVFYWFLVPGGWWPAVVALAATAVGIWATGVSEKVWRKKDPKRVCWDEFASLFVAVAFLPKTFYVLALAFATLRFYDIVKPFPAGRSQGLRGGWGIMADDFVAGCYANLTVQIVRWAALYFGCRPAGFQ